MKEISSIVFQDVCFKYNRNDFEIEKMNFEVKKGRFLGVVGKSGGGKTTIFDLITGLYYPNAGSVKINEFTTEQLNINKLRTKISVVTQDIVLFNGSIRENICFNNDIKENAYTNILNVVSLNDFIGQLPQGDQTDIGYNGELLSGGERQRISIANALLAESDVILLDEFTSALDLETEKRIVNHIFNLKDKIVIIISHRIYTLMNCDEVIVISKGNIIEKGNPKELCEQSDSFFAGMLGDMNYEAK